MATTKPTKAQQMNRLRELGAAYRAADDALGDCEYGTPAYQAAVEAKCSAYSRFRFAADMLGLKGMMP